MQTFSGVMTSLNPEWKSDSHLRLQVEDSMKTSLFGSQQTHITNDESPATTHSISVGQLEKELGVRLKTADSIVIGRVVSAQYHEKHGEPPSKHRQWVDGTHTELR